LQGILDTAIPGGITQGTGPVSPGVNFNLHITNITENRVFGKEGNDKMADEQNIADIVKKYSYPDFM
jgi:hypothetical protein